MRPAGGGRRNADEGGEGEMMKAKIAAEEFESLLADISKVTTAASLENLWLANHDKCRGRKEKPLRAAIETRGWQLVDQHPHGKRIPKVRIKGTHFEAEYMGKTFRSGYWQNGPGYRWCKVETEEWIFRVGNFRKRQLSDVIMFWVLYGMPHRALRALRRCW